MDYGDLILFPIYLILLHLFFKSIRKKYNDPILRKYHRQGFWVKVLGCVAFCIYSVYISPGDSTGLFQAEGNNFFHLILHNPDRIQWIFQPGKYFDESYLKNPRNAGYFQSEGNFMVIRFVTLLSFLTAGRYAVISLIFACIAYSGVWKLFLFFYEQYPHLHKKLAIAILFFPTFVFWSSGVLKDPLCIACLGWVTYSLYELFYRKKNLFKNIIILFLFGYLLAVLKVYIPISYVPFFLLFIILKNVQEIKNRFFQYLLAPTLILMCMVGFIQVLDSYKDDLGAYAVGDVTSSIKHLNGSFSSMDGDESADSNFDLGVEFDGTFGGLIRLAPVAIFTTFFRPFIWESHKASQYLAAIESCILLFFTLYILLKTGPLSFVRMILADPLIMYCFLFALVFALFVGASTLNFGTLVRYKIPCLPFYAISLFLIYEKVKEKSARKALARLQPAGIPETGSLQLAT